MASSFCSLQQALTSIAKSPDLTVCDLTGVQVRDAGISDLVFKLRKTKLRELILANCKIGKQGAIHLGTFLKYNTTVTRLYLQHNPDVGDEGIEELLKAIHANKTLQVLNVANCGIGDIGAAALSEYVSPHIQKLFLYDNRIGNLGACALAQLIASNEKGTGLQELYVWDNKINDDGLEALEEAYETVKADNSGVARLQLVTGLKNLKKKGKKPPVKRNFQLPKKKTVDVDTKQAGYAELQGFARELEAGPSSPSPCVKPKVVATASPIRSNAAIRSKASIFETSQKPEKLLYQNSTWSNAAPTKSSVRTANAAANAIEKQSLPKTNQSDNESSYDEEVVTDDEENLLHDAETERLEAQIRALQSKIAET